MIKNVSSRVLQFLLRGAGWVALLLLTSAVCPTTFGQGGTWETKADMPRARWGSAAGVVDDTFYVAGGYNDVAGKHLRWVDAYDPITDAWTSKNSRPRVQTSAAAGVVNGILYTVGGTNWSVAIADTWGYDPTDDSWTQKASMSAPRQRAAAGVVNDIVYVAGGRCWTPVATLEAYDPTTNSWTTLTSMPTARSAPAAGVVNHILYVAGGQGNSDIVATLEAYDPATDSWTTLSPMPTARYNAVAGVIDGILYVVGGRDISYAFATVEAYDPVTDTWSTMDPMPTARVDSVSAVIDGQLYVAGGYAIVDGVGVGVTTLEVFTPPDSVVSVDVAIDIKPGSEPNSINLRSNGVLPVAIFSTNDFDALSVDEETILFGDPELVGGSPSRSVVEDVDGDGLDDLLLFFSVPELDLSLDELSDMALLIGETFDGILIEGLDSVRIVPPKGRGKSGK